MLLEVLRDQTPSLIVAAHARMDSEFTAESRKRALANCVSNLNLTIVCHLPAFCLLFVPRHCSTCGWCRFAMMLFMRCGANSGPNEQLAHHTTHTHMSIPRAVSMQSQKQPTTQCSKGAGVREGSLGH